MNEVEQAIVEQKLELSDYADEPTPGLALAMAAIPDLQSRTVLEQLQLIVMATGVFRAAGKEE